MPYRPDSAQEFIGALVFMMTGLRPRLGQRGRRLLPLSAARLLRPGRRRLDHVRRLRSPRSLLLVFGLLLAGSSADLDEAIAADPIGALTTLLPTWFLVPFAAVAVLGLVGGAVLDIYSSGLALLAAGLRVPRPLAALVDGVLMIAGAVYIVFFADDFLGPFIGFLTTLGVPIAAWCGIMLADLLLRRRDYDEADLFRPAGRYGDVPPGPLLLTVAATVLGWGLVTNSAAELAGLAGLSARPPRPRRQVRRLGLRQPGRAARPGGSASSAYCSCRGGGYEAQEAPGSETTPAPPGLLAVIDMQRVFAEPASPWAAPRFAEAAAGVRRLLPAFAGRAVFTRFVAPERPEGAWRAYYDQWPFALQPPDAPLWQLVGRTRSTRHGTGRRPDLRQMGPGAGRPSWDPDGRLVLAGVSTDCCVLSTALAAADAGVEVLVVADACAGADDESHAKALHVLDLYRPLVRVVTVDEVLGQSRPEPR